MFLESAQKKETFATVFTKYFFLLMNSVDVNFELAFAWIAFVTLITVEECCLQMHFIDVLFQIGSQVKFLVAILTLNVICLVFLVGMVNKLDFGVETLCAHVAKVFHFV